MPPSHPRPAPARGPLAELPAGKRCRGCALRKGTEASRDAGTLEMLRGCIASGEPFYCHESTAVRDPNGIATDRRGRRYRCLPFSQWRVCRGWAAAVKGKGVAAKVTP